MVNNDSASVDDKPVIHWEIPPEDRFEYSQLEHELANGTREKCDLLKRAGDFWYCAKGLETPESQDPLTPFDPRYKQGVNLPALQTRCMTSNSPSCCFYNGALTWKDLKKVLTRPKPLY